MLQSFVQVDVIGVHIQDIVHPQDFMDMATIFHAQGRDIPPGWLLTNGFVPLSDSDIRYGFFVRNGSTW